MNVLLLSMPDSFEHMPPVAIRMPNGALASLAGNVDPHHRVAIADLILVQSHGRGRRSSGSFASSQPDVVGLSVMTFQRATALRIARLIRALRPAARIVVGGYDPSLAPEAYEVRAPMSTSSFAAKANRRSASCCARSRARRGLDRASPGSPIASDGGFVAQPADRPVAQLAVGAAPAAQSRAPACSAATRCSAGRSTWSKRRAAARSTAASARSSRCAAATSTRIRSIACWPTSRDARAHGARGDLPRRRQHHARRPPVRGAVPGDHRAAASTTSTTSCRR